MFCYSCLIVELVMTSLLAIAFAASSNCLIVKDAISSVAIFYFWCFISNICAREELWSYKTL